MLPLLILIILNVVNLAYFFLVTINLTGAARTATLYSIEGSYTPYATQEPPSGTSSGTTLTTTFPTVAYTAYQDLSGAVWNPTASTTTIQVCTQMNTNSSTGLGVNGTGASQKANCVTCSTNSGGCAPPGGSYTGSPVPSIDPEAPNFVLNQVDITYSFPTLIPGRIFNLPLAALCNSTSNCTFTRRARMRSMGP
jgi:hypothetical protein